MPNKLDTKTRHMWRGYLSEIDSRTDPKPLTDDIIKSYVTTWIEDQVDPEREGMETTISDVSNDKIKLTLPSGEFWNVTFNEVKDADKVLRYWLKRDKHPVQADFKMPNEAIGVPPNKIRNPGYAPALAERIRRELSGLPQAIRILPMSINSFTHENCRDINELQEKFFLGILPSKKRNGHYRYKNRKINSKPGTVVLFQCNAKIIAIACFLYAEEYKSREDGYKGFMAFDPKSIKIFNPIDKDTVKLCWPSFEGFSQSLQKLDPIGYPIFLKHIKGVKTGGVVDLVSPPERKESTIYRILRDTKMAKEVKQLHDYECQICGLTIELPDGDRYAESHHIQPLGTPHSGLDIKSNIICVCPNHHAALDYGAIPLSLKSIRVLPKIRDFHKKRVL